jgi:hypothetical protein
MTGGVAYAPMWRELGLDLAAHEGLLRALGQAYRDIYLSQQGRPAGMGYFDFVISEIHGLRIRESSTRTTRSSSPATAARWRNWPTMPSR